MTVPARPKTRFTELSARERAAEWRDEVVFWVYVAATANTLVWAWGGLGQLCLIGWGRRQIDGRAAHRG